MPEIVKKALKENIIYYIHKGLEPKEAKDDNTQKDFQGTQKNKQMGNTNDRKETFTDNFFKNALEEVANLWKDWQEWNELTVIEID